MKFVFTLSLFVLCSASLVPHSDACGVAVTKAYSQNVLGTNVGYYVVFKNNSGKTIDGIQWKAKFYNNFNDYKGDRKGEWSSGNFISPVKTGGTIEDLEGVWVEGATKVVIEITRVHYTDESSCVQ